MHSDLWRELALLPPPITSLQLVCQSGDVLALDILRLDLIHPIISGNKVFKLLPNLQHARQQGMQQLISFGGAYSNHIHALAYAGHMLGIKTRGIIRSDNLDSPTLHDAKAWGMQLDGVSHGQYRRRHEPAFLAQLMQQYPHALIIPEGGANSLAVSGCESILDYLADKSLYGAVVSACGTGTTLAGLINNMPPHWHAYGVSVLKAPWMATEVRRWLNTLGIQANWQIIADAHLGGYGRVNVEYLAWLDNFEHRYGMPLDPVYTGKALYALWSGKIPLRKGQRYLYVHTGGLQGKRGFASLTEEKIAPKRD
jgi:1-aminocyclopropane-1-carboxylate deaminase